MRFGNTRAGGKLRNWSNKGLFDRYYSAHTHKGFSAKHQTNEDASASFVEVNVGSLVDKPSEYVSLTSTVDNQGNVVTSCLRRPLTRRLLKSSNAVKDPHCEIGLRDPLFNTCYRNYQRYRDRDEGIPDRYSYFGQTTASIVQRTIYARLELHKDYASDLRGQKTHIRALAQELFGYNSIFSSIDFEAELAKQGRTITPVCFRTYTDICDATCEDGKHSACNDDDMKIWRKKRTERCRKAAELDSQCDKNFDVRELADGNWVRTNGRVLDSSRAVRHYLHYYLSRVLSASIVPEVCSETDYWFFAGLCIGPYPMEIELSRFAEAVETFLAAKLRTDHSAPQPVLCYYEQ